MAPVLTCKKWVCVHACVSIFFFVASRNPPTNKNTLAHISTFCNTLFQFPFLVRSAFSFFSFFVPSLTITMSGSCSGAAMTQVVAMTAVDAYLTGGATSTFFAYRSLPYAAFSTDFCTLTLTGAATLNEKTATQGTCTIDRRGDKLAKIFLQFQADAIMNISQEAITINGAATTGGNELATIKTMHRGIVGGLGPKQWVPVNLSAANIGGAICSWTAPGASGGVVTLATGLIAGVRVGDRVTLIGGLAITANSAAGSSALSIHVSTIQSITGDTFTLDLESPVVAASSSGLCTVEREINRGMVDCGVNPFMSEESESLPFTKVVVDGPGPGVAPSGIGIRYRGVGGDPRDLAAYYRPFAPALLVDSVTLLCGSQCLDTLTASALVIYHDVFVPQHQQSVRNMNAERDINILKKWALQPQQWRMLLPFNMCTSYAKALSLVSICLHNLKLNVKFNSAIVAVGNGFGGTLFTDSMTVTSTAGGAAPTSNAVVRTCSASASGLDTCITPWTTNGNALASGDPLSTASSNLFKGTSISCSVLVEYVFCGKAEREQEVNLNDRMVVIEHQTLQNVVVAGTGSVSTQLTFSHPIAALFCTAVSSTNLQQNDRQNYDGMTDPLCFHRQSPRDSLVSLIRSFQIKFNSAERTPLTDVSFYREIQNSNVVKNVPGTDILAYYFGLASPYDPQQSGSANFARLDRVDAALVPQPCYVKDNSNVGGLNGSISTVGQGASSAVEQLTVTFDVLSINVWEVSDCMMGRMYA